MNEPRYKIGELVVLGQEIPEDYEKKFMFHMYKPGTLVEVLFVSPDKTPIYRAVIPEIVGKYPIIFIRPWNIDHEATAELNKE